jgi:hypothetical protein
MEDGNDIGVSRKNGRDIVIGLPGVNDRRLGCFGSERQLRFEGTMLEGTGGVIVVEVETGLAHGNHARVSEKLTKPVLRIGVPLVGLVGVNAGRGYETGLGGRHGERALGGGSGLADHDHATHPCRPGPVQHLSQIGRVRLIGQMAVGVDQQRVSFLTPPSVVFGWAPAAIWASSGRGLLVPATASRSPAAPETQ